MFSVPSKVLTYLDGRPRDPRRDCHQMNLAARTIAERRRGASSSIRSDADGTRRCSQRSSWLDDRSGRDWRAGAAGPRVRRASVPDRSNHRPVRVGPGGGSPSEPIPSGDRRADTAGGAMTNEEGAHHRHHRPGRLVPRRAPARQGLRGPRPDPPLELVLRPADRPPLRGSARARRALFLHYGDLTDSSSLSAISIGSSPTRSTTSAPRATSR